MLKQQNYIKICKNAACAVEEVTWEAMQMSGQVSRGSAGDYKADERAGVARLSWRVSGR